MATLNGTDRFSIEMLAVIPALRAYAMSLTGNVDKADDLVQETLVRAIANRDSFTLGTNMSAWLFTILGNHFRSVWRKRKREIEDADGHYAETLTTLPDQHDQIELKEFRAAIRNLPADQREALLLVGGSGFSYEEAATICGCAEGTIKSRLHRARTRMVELLSMDSRTDLGQEKVTLSALTGKPEQ